MFPVFFVKIQLKICREISACKEIAVDNNFVLPETEKSLNLIISKIKLFFEIISLCFTGFYAAYTVFRIFFMPDYLIPNIMLSVISWTIFTLTLLEFLKKIHFRHTVHLVFEICKRTVCVIIFILVFISLFSARNEILPYKILFAMFCGAGIILSFIGDIFNATVPAWTQTVLDSFKSDIEISGLAERSLDQLKEELKKDEFKEKLTAGAISAGSSLVKNAFRNIFRRKNS